MLRNQVLPTVKGMSISPAAWLAEVLGSPTGSSLSTLSITPCPSVIQENEEQLTPNEKPNSQYLKTKIVAVSYKEL